MTDLEYLEEERKIMWEKINHIESMITQASSESLKEAKNNSKKTAEFRNKAELRLDEASSILNNFKVNNKAVLEYLETTKNTLDEITETHNDSFKQLESLSNNSTEAKDKISEINAAYEKFNSLYEDYSTYETQLDSLNNQVEKIDDLYTKITNFHTAINKRKNEIDKIRNEIYGHSYTDENTDEEIYVEGTKDLLENAYNKLNLKVSSLDQEFNEIKLNNEKNYEDFQINSSEKLEQMISKYEKNYTSIYDKITSLLPNALTTGLSYAYSEKKEAELKERENNQKTFMTAIKVMAFSGLLPLAISVLFIFLGKTFDEIISDVPRIVLAISPIYIPVFWVAHSASKKSNLSKRLIEEYSHKEALSKTFEGLSTQIENMEGMPHYDDLKTKLIYSMLEVNSDNPGNLITDYKKSDHPFTEALDQSTKLANAIEKVTQIPGLAHLATIIEKKSNNVKNEIEEKVATGLSSVQDNDD